MTPPPRARHVLWWLGLASASACQDDIATPFPPGLEPLEDNEVPDADVVTEELRGRSLAGDTVRVHGRGYVFAEPARLWALTKVPEAMIARCSTDTQTIMPNSVPSYEFSFLVHYVVERFLTVQWDDDWRYGVIDGTIDAPILGMIKHQKVQGSDFITLSAGTVQVHATPDPLVSELHFVEHLDAIGGDAVDVLAGMKANYDALIALTRGEPTPPCP